MKSCCFRIAIAFLALFVCAASDARAQSAEADLSRAPDQTVTLLSSSKQKDYSKSVFDFALGVRGDAVLVSRENVSDIRYGGITDDGNNHWFDVTKCGRARSRLKDLGQLKWEDVYYVPTVQALPAPHCGGVAWRFENGKVAEISPDGLEVRAVAGHMYVMRVKDEKSDFYVMFRVESLEPEGECTISWKRVPSPEADQQTAGK
jgi:hypothetical protein